MHGRVRKSLIGDAYKITQEEEKALQDKLDKGREVIDTLLRAKVKRNVKQTTFLNNSSTVHASCLSAPVSCVPPCSSLRSLHLQLTESALELHSEFSTLWNYRRTLLEEVCLSRDVSLHDAALKCSQTSELSGSFADYTSPHSFAPTVLLLLDELRFSERILKKNQKSYSVWFHREWVFRAFVRLEPPLDERANAFKSELRLIDEMLSMDDRNFHCWKYRASVLALLLTSTDTHALAQRVIAPLVLSLRNITAELDANQETKLTSVAATSASHLLRVFNYEYSTKMIHQNFSNYSAWHLRMKVLREDSGSDALGLVHFDRELELLKHGLYTEPNDESLWNYYRWFVMEGARTGLEAKLGLNHVSLHKINIPRNGKSRGSVATAVMLLFAQPTLCEAVDLSQNGYSDSVPVDWYPCSRFSNLRSCDCRTEPAFCWIGVLKASERHKQLCVPLYIFASITPKRRVTGNCGTPCVVKMTVSPRPAVVQWSAGVSCSVAWWVSQLRQQGRSVHHDVLPQSVVDGLVPENEASSCEKRLREWNILYQQMDLCTTLLDLEQRKCKYALLFQHELCETLELIYERLSSFERRHISSAAPYAFNQENVSLLGSERIHLLKLLAAIDPTRQQRYKELLDREHFFDRNSSSFIGCCERLPPAECAGWRSFFNPTVVYLNLSKRSLTDMTLQASGVHMLVFLKHLDLSGNQLVHLETVLSALPHCCLILSRLTVDLTGNPLVYYGNRKLNVSSDNSERVNFAAYTVTFELCCKTNSFPKRIVLSQTPIAKWCICQSFSKVTQAFHPHKVRITYPSSQATM